MNSPSLNHCLYGCSSERVTALTDVPSGFFFNSLIPSFADGGIISGPTVGLMGEYSGAKTNPEIVAPLDKLKSLMGGGVQQVEVFGRISGNDIWLTNSKTGINRNRGY